MQWRQHDCCAVVVAGLIEYCVVGRALAFLGGYVVVFRCVERTCTHLCCYRLEWVQM
jgi:hypothetical protein